MLSLLTSLVAIIIFSIQVSLVNAGHIIPSEHQEVTRHFYHQGTAFVVLPSTTPLKPSSTIPIPTIAASSTTPAIVKPLNPMAPTKQEFLDALKWNKYAPPTDEQYIEFVNRIDSDSFSSKREVAMFFAHMMHESGGLTVKSEERCAKNGCKGDYHVKGDLPGKRYFGRGYLQLTWSYHYKSASEALFGDSNYLLRNPEIVATNEKIAWDTAFWYWRVKVHPLPGVQKGEFGVATKRINGNQECGSHPELPWAPRRFRLYKKTLQAFHLNDKPNPKGCY